MKKLFLIIPLIIVSCDEADLTIPGENVGDIDGILTEKPVEEVYLMSYLSNYVNANFEININDNHKIVSVDDKTISFKDNQIDRVEIGNNVYNLSYENNVLTSISKENSNELTHVNFGDSNYSVTKYNGDTVEANYEFFLDNRGYIQGYEANFTSGNKITANFVFTNNNISKITYIENNSEAYEWGYAYDSQPNPLLKSGEEVYNTLMFLEAIEDELGSRPQFLPLLLLINQNNIIQSQVNDLVLNITYEYQNHMAQEGKVKNAAQEIKGSVQYIYKD